MKIKNSKKNIMYRVKTFEDACLIKKIIPSESYTKFLNTNNDSCISSESSEFEFLKKDEIAYKKLKIIVEVLNEGWIPNWNNSNEFKFYPYFSVDFKFGFLNSNSLSDTNILFICSKLLFKSEELSDYAGKQFLEIYREYMLK